MESINRIELQGRVGSVKTFEQGRVARFSVATSEVFKSQGGAVTVENTWHNCVAWAGAKTPDIASLAIGAAVRVTGRLRTSSYVNKEGTEIRCPEIVVSELHIISNN